MRFLIQPARLCLILIACATHGVFSNAYAAESVARFSSDFSTQNPAVGWQYLWNASGAIGDTSAYQPLLASGSRYDSDGVQGLPDVGELEYGHIDVSGGHPGRGVEQGVAADRYAIAAFTVAQDGDYSIDNSFITATGCQWSNGVKAKVAVDDNEYLERIVDVGETAQFDMALGFLPAGSTIYFALGPNGRDGCDGSDFDFEILRREAVVTTARYSSTFQTPTPAAGWRYLWNATGAIGEASTYVDLLAGSSSQYDSDGVSGLPDNSEMGYGHLRADGGHAGRGINEGVNFDRYAIAAYTVPTSGRYRIGDGQISHTGCQWTNGITAKILVNNNERFSTTLLYQASEVLDVDMGELSSGDKIYVAIGPNGDDGCDGFAMDYSVIGTHVLSEGNTYYVDVNAAEPGAGTLADPWTQPAQAMSVIELGDTVLLRAGVYSNGLRVTTSGAPGQPLTFASYPGEQATFTGKCVEVKQQSHVVIRGFKITECMGGSGQDSKGVYVEGTTVGGGVSDITIEDNHIDHTFGSAISVWGVPWRQNPENYSNISNVYIRNNLIERANDGGYNEQITLANGVVNFEIAYNELREGADPVNGGEGIDIKEGCSYGEIHNNYIHGINRRAIYIDGAGRLEWFSPTHHIDVYNNIAHSVPNGFAIMSEGKADVNNVRVFNNLIYDVSGDCAFVFDHPNMSADAKFNDITFVNNTFVDCATAESYRTSLHLNTSRANNIIAHNNILSSGYKIKSGLVVDEDQNVVEEDPNFVDAANRNYRLNEGSPAVDAGNPTFAPVFDIVIAPRPSGVGFDIGAYER